MRSFPYKGYGRIIVKSSEDTIKVKAILKAMDEFEFPYLPDDLITEDEEDSVYVGKFQPDLDRFEELCKEQKIEVKILEETRAENQGIYDIDAMYDKGWYDSFKGNDD